MLPDIQALLQGQQQGKSLMQGMLPSADNVGGAQAPLDPLKPDFEAIHGKLMALAANLHQKRDERHSNMVLKLATQLQSISLDRRKQFAQQAADSASGQSPMAVAGGLNAMGVPR